MKKRQQQQKVDFLCYGMKTVSPVITAEVFLQIYARVETCFTLFMRNCSVLVGNAVISELRDQRDHSQKLREIDLK